METLIILGILLLFAIVVIVRTVRIVPQQTSLIIERLDLARLHLFDAATGLRLPPR